MKLLVYADLQAHDGNERCYTDPNTSLQLYRVRKFYQDLRDIYEEHGCIGLVDLGDTTDDRSSIPVPVLDAVLAGLELFPSSDFNMKIMGNHEQFVRDTSLDSGRVYSRFFSVVNQLVVSEVGGTVYILASYTDDFDGLTQQLNEAAAKYRSHRKILFGHFPVVGAKMGSREALQGVPRATLDKFNVNLLGHIHLPQSLGKRIHYIGSPFQQHWGEMGEDKRVGILDLTNLSMTWVPMDGFPQYRYADLDEFREQFREDSEHRWKVRLRNHEETQAFFKMPCSNRYEAVYEYTLTDNTLEADQDVPDWSLEKSLEHWVSTTPPSGYKLDLSAEEMLLYGRQMAGLD